MPGISQTDAEHIDRARSGEVSGVAGKPAARDKGFDCCVRRKLHLRCTTRRGGSRLPIEE